MKEEFLYFIWQHKLFNPSELRTTDGEVVTVLKTGERNSNSGPDFNNATIQIGDTKWVGNVEIHQKTSDWNLHKHTADKAYNNVILHVVFEHDKEAFTQNGIQVPVLALKNCSIEKHYENYLHLLANSSWIPCQESIRDVDRLTTSFAMQRFAIERLENKTQYAKQLLKETKGSWENTFYYLLAHYFGSKLNTLPFELLAKSLDLNIFAKHKDNLLQIEALLFGQAGFLDDDFKDEYPLALQAEYKYLKTKYKLIPIEKHLWQFFRLRPYNFPTIRISQFASLIYHSRHLFSKVLLSENIEDLTKIFSCSSSGYWNTHYLFDKAHSSPKVKNAGATFVTGLITNVVATILFCYAEQHASDVYKEHALSLLEKLPPESNTIIEGWKNCGIKASSTLESQALLELYNNYCHKKNCLQCNIGYKIIKESCLI